MGADSLKRKALRTAQKLAFRAGLDVRRAQNGFAFWHKLPGGAPKTVLDIGANAGQFARKVLASLPDCTVHSFEPLPGPFAQLRSLAAQHPGLHGHNFALGDQDGGAVIHTGDYTASSSLLKPAQHLNDSMPQAMPGKDAEIAIRRLDDWAAETNLDAPLFIKLDVQGYELQVIRGGGQTLKRACAVLSELSFVELYEGQPLIGDVIAAMAERGFRLADIYEVWRDPATGLGFQCDGLFLPVQSVGDP